MSRAIRRLAWLQSQRLITAMRHSSMLIMLAVVSALLFGCTQSLERDTKPGDSELISVLIGPTLIPRGDARGATDITVSNEFFALAFAVETASPWGVAKGGILDIAIMHDGSPGPDFASLVDFMPNYWSAWPTTYQRVALEKNTPEHVIVRTQRNWGEVELDTRFEIRAGSKLVRIHTQMANHSSQTMTDLTTGYIAWPNGGQLFGMPGLFSESSTPVAETPALGRWSASYDRNWALGLHTQYSELVGYKGRDRYIKHTLGAGEVREFEAWLQIEDSAELSRMVQTELDAGDIPAGRVFGQIVNEQGEIVAESAAVIRRDGRLYTWALAVDGYYDMNLPQGDYEIYATAAGHAPGEYHVIKVVEGEKIELRLSDMLAPSKLSFSVIEKNLRTPLDAMISITKGNKPVIQYFGKSRFFTELAKPGQVSLSIPPGDYEFDVSAAGGFTTRVLSMPVSISSGEELELTVEIPVLADPAQQHWYSADLHHHSDVLDGFTEPEFVLRAQLAAGVNLAFLSDHDSAVNNAEMTRLAEARDMGFIGGTELSASWGHFNAYPLDPEKTVNPNAGTLPVQEIYAEARRLGAEIISVNHPFGNYGYLNSLKKEADSGAEAGSVVPGGYDTGFDLIEITVEHVPQTLQHAWQLWNQRKPAYFSAGSDVHDVWSVSPEAASGSARSYVHVAEELTVESFVAALKAGHSYASQGPIIYPEIIFGTELQYKSGDALKLNYKLQAIAGLRSVQLIERAVERQSRWFDQAQGLVNGLTDITFSVRPTKDTWYSLVVSDTAGNYAYSNPLWVKLEKHQSQFSNRGNNEN